MGLKRFIGAVAAMGFAFGVWTAAASNYEMSEQTLPPVYLNHVGILLNAVTYAALGKSQFLTEEFSAFEQKTYQQNGGARTYTGSYWFGQHTSLEFLSPELKGGPAPGSVQLNMSIDDLRDIPAIKTALTEHTHVEPVVRANTFFANGRDVPWFTSVTTPAAFSSTQLIRSNVQAYAPEHLKARYPDLKPEEDGTTREKYYARRYRPDRLLHDITRVALTVEDGETEPILAQLAAYGYGISSDKGERIAHGPEIEIAIRRAAKQSERSIELGMSLNSVGARDHVYPITPDSSLRIEGHSARWQLPLRKE